MTRKEMKQLLTTLCGLLISIVVHAGKNKTDIHFPLTPIPADSIEVQDFFWYGQLHEAEKALPGIKARSLPQKLPSPKKTKKLATKWQKKIQNLDIRGFVKGEKGKDELQSAIDLAEESATLALSTGDAKYADVMSRAYYNGICGWQNSSEEEAQRAAQAITNLPGYALATSGEHLYINMYIRSEAKIKNDKLDFTLQTTTSTPWYYQTLFQFLFKKKQQHIVFHFRLPEWLKKEGENTLPGYDCKTQQPAYVIQLNGDRLKPVIENGYLVVDEVLCDTDIMVVQMPTPIIRITPKDNPTKVALQKGPLVYTFLNMPQDMEIKGNDAYHSEFDKHRHTNVLSGDYYNKETKAGRFTAEPYIFNRKNEDNEMWFPFHP